MAITSTRPRAQTPGGPRPGSRKTRLVPRYVGYVYLAPALVVFGLFLLAPFVHSVYLSFFSWDGITPKKYVGLANYRDALGSSEVRGAFSHAVILIGFYAGLTTAVALILVGIMGSTRVRGLVVLRTILFLPYVIAPVVTGVAWRWLLSPDGPVNAVFRALGLGRWARPWLGDFTWALPSVGLIGTWMLYGLVMVLLLAAVQRIPMDLYEAARLDGAGPVREFFAVTLPGVRQEVVVVLVLAVTAALRNFDLIYVTTQGGPGTSTEVPSWMVYRQAFFVGTLGKASALGVLLTALIMVLSLLILRPWKRS
ncbi:MAG: raffinose/stachyose/melibiose transport system permease protein [Pseudonocardiales bacterium]|nr:sugar transporter permease [Jatrophihabitans sp.]MDT4904520.1 raffinose/stachyose/melibiose transport system permease protein [Pseudonocardiales bacterium]MDT4929799.1 raffinose/stachyose/melibiose transport system permease protein [Pseudonocardiales bacterium]